MNNILEHILNKNKDENFLTGVISSLSPLEVKLYPGDDAIPVKCLSHLLGIKVNSNVLLARFQSKFIIIGIISDSPYPIGHCGYVGKASDTTRASQTTVTDDPHLSITLPPYGKYRVYADLVIDAESGGDVGDFKARWGYSDITGISSRCIRGIATNETSTYTAEMSSDYCNLTTERATGTVAAGWTWRSEVFDVKTTSAAGIMTYQWAQNTSDSVGATLKEYSRIFWIKFDDNI